jgi:hypothetical protein
MRRLAALGSLALLLASCGDSGPSSGSGTPTPAPAYVVSEPRVLSTGSPGKDEDPSVLRARDGSMFVAWFSDRTASGDIYVTRTTDGVSWSTPARVTTAAGGDFNPSLIQDASGRFHLAWFRWDALFVGHVYYNSSADGLTWDPAAEVAVTTAPDVEDWVPTLVPGADGTLFIYFVSAKRTPSSPVSEIYVASRRPSETSWSEAMAVAGINSAAEHDHLPFAARTSDRVALVWVRHDASQALPWLNPKSDLYYASSTDGLTFTAPVPVTSEPGSVVNLFPQLYSSHAGDWNILWLSTRAGAPKVYEQPLGFVGQYPQGVVERVLPDGYSHKIAATPTAGVYLAAWVQGPDGAQDVFYQFLVRN